MGLIKRVLRMFSGDIQLPERHVDWRRPVQVSKSELFTAPPTMTEIDFKREQLKTAFTEWHRKRREVETRLIELKRIERTSGQPDWTGQLAREKHRLQCLATFIYGIRALRRGHVHPAPISWMRTDASYRLNSNDCVRTYLTAETTCWWGWPEGHVTALAMLT